MLKKKQGGNMLPTNEDERFLDALEETISRLYKSEDNPYLEVDILVTPTRMRNIIHIVFAPDGFPDGGHMVDDDMPYWPTFPDKDAH